MHGRFPTVVRQLEATKFYDNFKTFFDLSVFRTRDVSMGGGVTPHDDINGRFFSKFSSYVNQSAKSLSI